MLGQTLSKSRFLRHSNWRDPLSVVAKIDSATTLALALLIIEKGLAQDFASGTSPEFVPYLLGVGILGLLLGSRIAAAWSVEKRPKLAAWTLLLTLPILSLSCPWPSPTAPLWTLTGSAAPSRRSTSSQACSSSSGSS